MQKTSIEIVPRHIEAIIEAKAEITKINIFLIKIVINNLKNII